MAVRLTPYTRTDYMQLPEGFPAQLVEGHLVREPAPTFGHQRIASEIHALARRLVGPRRTVIAPIDIVIDDLNVFQPDVVVFREPIGDDALADDLPTPLLVAEVLSPATASRDRDVKRIRLLDAGVEEVWLVDRAERRIEVFDRRRYRDIPRRAMGDVPIASCVLEGFELTPSMLWR